MPPDPGMVRVQVSFHLYIFTIIITSSSDVVLYIVWWLHTLQN